MHATSTDLDTPCSSRRSGGERKAQMPVSQHQEGDRTCLAGLEADIVTLVRKEATSEQQWKEWLRVPLEHAAAKGSIKLFTGLMGAGADGSAGWRGHRGRTLLGSAARGRNEEVVSVLLKDCAKRDLNVKFGERSESALHVAAAHGAEAVSATLMLAGADPDLRDEEGRTPLHVAAKAGQHGVVKELLLKGASPTAKTRDKNNKPLHLAAQKGSALCVSKLLLGGADKDSLNCCGETPLYLAAQGNRLGAVEELLAAGANTDLRAKSYMSPLDRAAVGGREDVVKTLLRHGGDINAHGNDCRTALLFVAEAKPIRDNCGIVRTLLAAGADIERSTFVCGWSALHLAAYRRVSPTRTMYALLEGGAHVDTTDFRYQTPLHLACLCSNVAGVELLLRWGASEDFHDEALETPLEKVGKWGPYDVNVYLDEQRISADQCIRRMLARAPADRSWRRRGWFVLGRDPTVTKVQLAPKSSGGNSSAAVAKAGCGSRRDGDENGDQSVDDVGGLVRRVVELEEEGIFRTVVGFL